MTSEDIAATLLHQVMTIAGQVTGRMQEGLDRLGLTEPMANLLWILQPDGDPAPLRTLATAMRCDPSNITLLSAKLEDRGLAARRPHPHDGRVRTLVLTPAGRRTRQQLLDSVARHSPLAGLDGQEQQQLTALLAKAIATA